MADDWGKYDAWGMPKRSRGTKRNAILLVAALCGAGLYGLGVWTGGALLRGNATVAGTPGANGNTGGIGSSLPPAAQDANAITTVYNEARQSIFTITAVTPSTGKGGPSEDIGTGFLIDNQGDLATNAHVVNGQKTVSVNYGNQTYHGTVIGSDTLDDLAVVRLSPVPNAAPLVLGSASALQPGEFVIAIGNPFQLTASVSSGIVSGLNRSMPTQTGHVMDGLVQTDAALNPGNSGGPLLNLQGQVVGINTAIESPVEGSVGIGFAIPIDRLKQLLPKLLAGGQTITHAWLGIRGNDVDAAFAQAYQLPVTQGAYVVQVTKGGPASKAGLHGDSAAMGLSDAQLNSTQFQLKGDGDIITALDGQSVTTLNDLTTYISQHAPGDVVTLTVLRNGKSIKVSVTLGDFPTTTP